MHSYFLGVGRLFFAPTALLAPGACIPGFLIPAPGAGILLPDAVLASLVLAGPPSLDLVATRLAGADSSDEVDLVGARFEGSSAELVVAGSETGADSSIGAGETGFRGLGETAPGDLGLELVLAILGFWGMGSIWPVGGGDGELI